MRDPQFDEMLRFLAELKQGHCGDVKVINHLNVHPDSFQSGYGSGFSS
jgi:hypothetical protein